MPQGQPPWLGLGIVELIQCYADSVADGAMLDFNKPYESRNNRKSRCIGSDIVISVVLPDTVCAQVEPNSYARGIGFI
jgi:hypothetical protein